VGDLEVVEGGIGGPVDDLHIADVVAEVVFEVGEAGVYVGRFALGEHLDRAIGLVADETGQVMPAGVSKGGEAEAYPLDVSGEDDVSGDHFRIAYRVLRWLRPPAAACFRISYSIVRISRGRVNPFVRVTYGGRVVKRASEAACRRHAA